MLESRSEPDASSPSITAVNILPDESVISHQSTLFSDDANLVALQIDLISYKLHFWRPTIGYRMHTTSKTFFNGAGPHWDLRPIFCLIYSHLLFSHLHAPNRSLRVTWKCRKDKSSRNLPWNKKLDLGGWSKACLCFDNLHYQYCNSEKRGVLYQVNYSSRQLY